MDKTITETIKNRIGQIEKEQEVEIFYAIESGSRAWGFESSDSDYDVRFIYKHKRGWYINVLPKTDTIEYPIVDEFDYSGWDIRKALFLLNKSNPVLFEWLQSPIVYKKDDKLYRLLKEVANHYFSPIATVYHYLHMAKGNYRTYLQKEIVKVKKYFYVLRPILACKWVETKKEPPPMEFERLLKEQEIEKDLVNEIEELLKRKKSGIELGLEPKRKRINLFIEKNIDYFENKTKIFEPKNKPDSKLLDECLVRIVKRE